MMPNTNLEILSLTIGRSVQSPARGNVDGANRKRNKQHMKAYRHITIQPSNT